MTNSKSFWNKFWRNKEGHLTIWQSPNIPITIWFVSLILAKIFSAQVLNNGFQFISSAALFAWAYLEITDGDSYFRRLLGIVVMISLLVGHFSR